jgi:hypothetical protein
MHIENKPLICFGSAKVSILSGYPSFLMKTWITILFSREPIMGAMLNGGAKVISKIEKPKARLLLRLASSLYFPYPFDLGVQKYNTSLQFQTTLLLLMLVAYTLQALPRYWQLKVNQLDFDQYIIFLST